MTSPVPAHRAFTLIELLVVIAIVAILAALLFPTFRSAQKRARATQSLNNLRQMALGMRSYANDNDMRIPGMWRKAGDSTWMDKFLAHAYGVTLAEAYLLQTKPYTSAQYWRSPYHKFKASWPLDRSYGINDWLDHDDWGNRLSVVWGKESRIILLTDMVQAGYESVATSDSHTRYGVKAAWPKPAYRHQEETKAQAVFFDGHVEALGMEDLKREPQGKRELTRWIPWWLDT